MKENENRICTYCDREISRDAKSCPFCGGERPDMHKGYVVMSVIAVVGIVIVAGLWLMLLAK